MSKSLCVNWVASPVPRAYGVVSTQVDLNLTVFVMKFKFSVSWPVTVLTDVNKAATSGKFTFRAHRSAVGWHCDAGYSVFPADFCILQQPFQVFRSGVISLCRVNRVTNTIIDSVIILTDSFSIVTV